MRAPWTEFPDGALPVISDALLDAVAAPRHKPLRVRLRFADDAPDATVPVLESPLLAQCSYITGMLDVTGAEAPEAEPDALAADADSPAESNAPLVPLPPQFTRNDWHNDWRDLQRVIAGKDPEIGAAAEPTSEDADAADAELPAFLRSPAAYEARIAALVDLADYLGVPAGDTTQLRAAGAGGGRNRADEMRVDMGWARAAIRAARRAENGVLDDVDAALAVTLRHTPLLQDAPNNDRWLLHTLPRARSGVAPGTCVLKPDPVAAALESLPELVLTALRNEAGHLALAGGAALAAVAAPGILERESLHSECYDFDLFVYDLPGDAAAKGIAADGIVRRVYQLFSGSSCPDYELHVMVSRNAVTLFISDDASYHETVVQVILRIAESPADILAGFDLAPAKVLITFEPSPADPFSPQLKVIAAPDWSLAMRHGAFVLDGLRWSRATALRVFKYHAKGFDALIPVLRDRRKIRYTVNASKWWRKDSQKLQHLDGFELLFAIERRFLNQRVREERLARWQHSYVLRRKEKYEASPPRRVSLDDVLRTAKALRMAQRSDYATVLTMMQNWIWIIWYAGARVLKRLGIISVPQDKLAAPLAWRQPWSAAQFHPVNSDVLDALNLADAK